MNENASTGNNVSTIPPQAQLGPSSAQGQPIISAPDPTNAPEQESQTKPLVIGLIVLIVMIVSLAITIIIVMVLKSSKPNVSMESVKNYCNNHNFDVNENTTSLGVEMTYISCQPTIDSSSDVPFYQKDDYVSITFGVAEKPIMEYDEYRQNSDRIMDGAQVLEEGTNYLKLYSSSEYSDIVSYLIISDNTYLLLTAKNNDLAKKALVEIGYPDKAWSAKSKSDESTDTNDSMLVSGRDTARRNDMSRVDTSLVQYQTNHSDTGGNLPDGPSYWEGETTFNCASANAACNFAKLYMNPRINDEDDDNSFIDPDGTPYSFYITENWAKTGSITPSFGNSDSLLIASGNGYAIGGDSPFEQHVIYIIPGAMCNDETIVVSEERHFAIMYKLEKGQTYCIDDK